MDLFPQIFEPNGSIEFNDFVTLISYLPVTKLIGNFEITASKSKTVNGEELVRLLSTNLNHKLSNKLKLIYIMLRIFSVNNKIILYPICYLFMML